MTPTQSTSLYFREGNSDKEYHAAIEPKGDGHIVIFAYGRRGSTLNTGIKTPSPVSHAEAVKVFDKLVASKIAKGYRPSGTPAPAYQQNGSEGTDTGVRCQLLNAVEESELQRLLTGHTHCLQEKHDGRRLLVRKQDHVITGISRRGLAVAIPEPIRAAVALVPGDCLIDGEAVADTLHAFDLLEVNGHDLRKRRYLDRHSGLLMLLPPNQQALRWVSTAIDPNDKVEIYQELKGSGAEGVVFKEVDAPFSPGRPNSGGTQLKFKFVESASFVVTGHNAKRSVTLGLYDADDFPGHGSKLVFAGNVTIPPNHEIPPIGTVCDARYLYAMRSSGAIYQPVYLGPRSDIPEHECTVDQLKYKPEPSTASAA